jgi:nucleotide-binding universal stress UspA family protein
VTRFLVATDSVHATAAACDYLAGRLAEGDAVLVVAVVGGDADERDAAEALSVATPRLAAADADTTRREGDPVAELAAAAEAFGADELVLAARSDPGATGLGETASAVLAATTLPVVVVRGA